jgi:hypothetical protein
MLLAMEFVKTLKSQRSGFRKQQSKGLPMRRKKIFIIGARNM